MSRFVRFLNVLWSALGDTFCILALVAAIGLACASALVGLATFFR